MIKIALVQKLPSLRNACYACPPRSDRFWNGNSNQFPLCPPSPLLLSPSDSITHIACIFLFYLLSYHSVTMPTLGNNLAWKTRLLGGPHLEIEKVLACILAMLPPILTWPSQEHCYSQPLTGNFISTPLATFSTV